ncbi:MAG: AbrB/MazE/SpoVT family DNA-binding domain-containing protein [Desulfurococcales archaeon]|nr:AbrB/MazE/SpoVT family DNA-binding domain-containing protein [Desulfurococcales archaeon]
MTLVVETRKVQRLGSSSLVVTLPKNWARKNKLKPGDPIYMVDDGDQLKIVPGSDRKPSIMEEVAIKYTKNIKELGLEKIIKCAYLNGYNSIRIEYAASYQKPDEIIRTADKLSYVASIQEEYNTVKITFEEDEVDPNKYLRRIFVEYQNLVEIIKDSIETGRVDDAKIREIVETLDKLHNFYRLSINKTCSQTPAREGDRMSRHAATSILGVLPRIMAGLAWISARYKGDKTVKIIIDKAIIAFREAVGSYLSESLKRIQLYQSIRRKVSSLMEENAGKYPDLKAKVEDLLYMLDELANDTICLSLKRDKK